MFKPSDKVILVSAGHTNVSGQDRGAAGNGQVEGILATKLRDAVAKTIRAIDPDVSVLEDGADGVNDPLKKAVALARKADVAVEFHWNAGSSANATGIEVLSKPRHKELAQELAQAIHDATGIRLRGERGWKSDSSGQHHRLAFCEAGGLIVEVCFISNPGDLDAYFENFGEVVLNIASILCDGKRPRTHNSSVEGETADVDGPDRNSSENPALSQATTPPPTTSTTASVQISDQGLAGTSAAQPEAGPANAGSGLLDKFDSTTATVDQFSGRFDWLSSMLSRLSAFGNPAPIFRATFRGILQMIFFAGSILLSIPWEHWIIGAVLVSAFSLGFFYRKDLFRLFRK